MVEPEEKEEEKEEEIIENSDQPDQWGDYSEEIISEIALSDEFSENKEYELITTAKQTDHRY